MKEVEARQRKFEMVKKDTIAGKKVLEEFAPRKVVRIYPTHNGGTKIVYVEGVCKHCHEKCYVNISRARMLLANGNWPAEATCGHGEVQCKPTNGTTDTGDACYEDNLLGRVKKMEDHHNDVSHLTGMLAQLVRRVGDIERAVGIKISNGDD